ncbi:hypothetical protein E4U11_006908, partial [Claviceps purpurea]
TGQVECCRPSSPIRVTILLTLRMVTILSPMDSLPTCFLPRPRDSALRLLNPRAFPFLHNLEALFQLGYLLLAGPLL